MELRCYYYIGGAPPMDSWPLEEKMGVAQLAKSYQATGTGLHWLFSMGLKERGSPHHVVLKMSPKMATLK